MASAVGLASPNASGFSDFSSTHWVFWVFCRKPKPISTSRSIPMPPFIQNSVSAGQSLLWFLCHTHIFIISYILFLWLASEEVVSVLLLQGPKRSLATTPVEARDGNKSTTLTYLYLTNQILLKFGSIANLRPVRLVPTQHPAFDLPTRKIMDFGVMQAATLDMSVHEHEYSRHWMPFFDSLPLSFVLKGPREQKPSWRREGHLPKFPSRFRTPYSQRTSKHIKHGSTHH